MSLILKGIDLPHEEINLTITKDGRIYLDNKYHLIAEAIQIPKSHGRLIDERKILLTNLEIFMCEGDYKEVLKLICEKLDGAPTILKAEE